MNFPLRVFYCTVNSLDALNIRHLKIWIFFRTLFCLKLKLSEFFFASNAASPTGYVQLRITSRISDSVVLCTIIIICFILINTVYIDKTSYKVKLLLLISTVQGSDF